MLSRRSTLIHNLPMATCSWHTNQVFEVARIHWRGTICIDGPPSFYIHSEEAAKRSPPSLSTSQLKGDGYNGQTAYRCMDISQVIRARQPQDN